MPIQPVQIVPKQRVNIPASEELMPLIVGYELEKIKEICELLALRQDRFSDIIRIWMAVDTLAQFSVRWSDKEIAMQIQEKPCPIYATVLEVSPERKY
jgi:hypothetical protein